MAVHHPGHCVQMQLCGRPAGWVRRNVAARRKRLTGRVSHLPQTPGQVFGPVGDLIEQGLDLGFVEAGGAQRAPGAGQNRLGEALMRARAELRAANAGAVDSTA